MQSCVHGYLALTCPQCRKGSAGGAPSFGGHSSPPAGTDDVIDLGNVADRVSDMFARNARRQGPKPTIQYDPPETPPAA